MKNLNGKIPIAWTIAASDSSSGAGIQADLATFSIFKVHGCSVITSITSQNTIGINDNFTVPGNVFKNQLHALKDELIPISIKISVIGNHEQLNEIVNFLSNYDGYSVFDPVFVSSNGVTLTNNNLEEAIKRRLLPLVTLITPNIPEAEQLTSTKIATYQDIINAGKILLKLGAKNVLIKSGHLNSNLACDFFINHLTQFWLINKKIVFSQNVHGTGCHLSSAIAANLALGFDIPDSIILSKRYLNSAFRSLVLLNPNAKQFYIPNYKTNFINNDMPVINSIPKLSLLPFPECDTIDLYPVIDSITWIKRLLKTPIKTMQLRIKNKNLTEIEEEIKEAIILARDNNINLFINDYWEIAIKYNAYGIHLGQEDLCTANIDKIHKSGVRLGISTHSYYELAIALAINPSYIALGPIFPTTSKIMPWKPQEIERLKEWRNMLQNKCQIVAIGGINLNNIEQIVDVGIKNIALISGITNAQDPIDMTYQLLKSINKHE